MRFKANGVWLPEASPVPLVSLQKIGRFWQEGNRVVLRVLTR